MPGCSQSTSTLLVTVKILNLFIKAKNPGRVEMQSLFLHRGLGVEGDANARVGSPRQVLLVDRPTLQQFNLQPGDLGENLLVDEPVNELISGQVVQIGSALICPTIVCEPCDKLNRIQPGLAKKLLGRRGVLGRVVGSGQIQVGDPVTPTVYTLPAMPETVRDRLDQFLARIPAGKVVRTSDILLALGLFRSYYRVLPRLLKTGNAELPVHRVVAIDGTLLIQHLPNQAKLLTQEGVQIRDDRVMESDYWQAVHFHELGDFSSLPLGIQ